MYRNDLDGIPDIEGKYAHVHLADDDYKFHETINLYTYVLVFFYRGSSFHKEELE